MKKLGTLSQSKHGLAGSSKMDGTMVTVGQSKVQGAKQATVQFHVVWVLATTKQTSPFPGRRQLPNTQVQRQRAHVVVSYCLQHKTTWTFKPKMNSKRSKISFQQSTYMKDLFWVSGVA